LPVQHERNHPDVHAPWSEWSEEQTLHVAVSYSNPFRWRTRRELANHFRRHMGKSPNVKLHFGELAYGDRPWELTDPASDPGDVQLRTNCELFHKENILNRVIQSFPPNWKYGAWIDADFLFTRHDWALETVHQLQHYDFVQLFGSYADLSGNVYGIKDAPVRYNSGFFFNYAQNGHQVSEQFQNQAEYGTRGVGATGGAMAFTRPAFETVGGLLDRCILGHADWYMAYSLVGLEAPDIHTQNYHPDYKRYVNAWRERAQDLKKNVGFVDGFATHYFHGSKTRRGYSTRDEILAAHQFSPYTDLHPDYQGIYQLNPNKPDLRDNIRRYFISRFEDDPNLYGSERILI
jgi:hypothetical protein